MIVVLVPASICLNAAPSNSCPGGVGCKDRGNCCRPGTCPCLSRDLSQVSCSAASAQTIVNAAVKIPPGLRTTYISSPNRALICCFECLLAAQIGFIRTATNARTASCHACCSPFVCHRSSSFQRPSFCMLVLCLTFDPQSIAVVLPQMWVNEWRLPLARAYAAEHSF
jgi:hypothetical protein